MSERIVVLLARPARHIWPPKAPADLADFSIDWTARLGAGDAVATSRFELPPGLVSPRASNTGTVATVWISGGAEGAAYEIVNRVTTAKGRECEQTVRLRVKTA